MTKIFHYFKIILRGAFKHPAKVEVSAMKNNVYKLYDKAIQENRRLLDKEYLLAKNARVALQYAENVIHGRFKMAEDIIAKKSYESCYYAFVLNNMHNNYNHRNPKLKKKKFNDFFKFKNKRFKKGEKTIAKEPLFALIYATYIIEDRFDLFDEYVKNYFKKARAYPCDYNVSCYVFNVIGRYKPRKFKYRTLVNFNIKRSKGYLDFHHYASKILEENPKITHILQR